MASASPEQQSAARAMKNHKPGKSAKPGKIDRHRAALAKRSFFVRLGLMSQIKTLGMRSRVGGYCSASAKAVSSASGTLRATALQILSVLLKKLSALFGLGSVACGGAGGGGSSSSGRTDSGSDPPHHVSHFIFNKITMRRPNLKEIGTGAALLIAAATPMKADASVIRDVEFGQADGESGATFYLQNNDHGVTYNSAELKYNALLTGVAQAVKEFNSDYSSMSLGDIMGEWGFQIRGPPTGEVKDGWSANLNSGALDLSHGIFGVTPWLSTSDNSNPDEMAISINFYDQLDFNHNGQYDSALEQLSWTGTNVEDAFTGSAGDGLNFYKTDAKAITVIQRTPITNLTLSASTLSWPSVSNTTYKIESNTNLLTDTWNTYTNLTATGTNTFLDIDMTEDRMFYRGK